MKCKLHRGANNNLTHAFKHLVSPRGTTRAAAVSIGSTHSVISKVHYKCMGQLMDSQQNTVCYVSVNYYKSSECVILGINHLYHFLCAVTRCFLLLVLELRSLLRGW